MFNIQEFPQELEIVIRPDWTENQIISFIYEVLSKHPIRLIDAIFIHEYNVVCLNYSLLQKYTTTNNIMCGDSRVYSLYGERNLFCTKITEFFHEKKTNKIYFFVSNTKSYSVLNSGMFRFEKATRKQFDEFSIKEGSSINRKLIITIKYENI